MRWLTALALVLCAGAAPAQPARQPAAAAAPLAHFNHLYATVDAGTARAIKDSKFLAGASPPACVTPRRRKVTG